MGTHATRPDDRPRGAFPRISSNDPDRRPPHRGIAGRIAPVSAVDADRLSVAARCREEAEHHGRRAESARVWAEFEAAAALHLGRLADAMAREAA